MLQLQDLLRCFAAVELLAPLLKNQDVTNVLQNWSKIKEIVNILSIPSEATIAVEGATLTLSDVFGVLLRMEIKLENLIKKRKHGDSVGGNIAGKTCDPSKAIS